MKKTVLWLRRRIGVYGMIGFFVFLLGMAVLSAASLSAAFADLYVRRVGSALSAAGELAAATLGGSGSLTAFERACDDALVRYLQRARRTPFGPEVIVGYLSAKEAEFTAVRTILSGKLAGLDAEDIRARLRLSYL